jgi:hypothetical protein
MSDSKKKLLVIGLGLEQQQPITSLMASKYLLLERALLASNHENHMHGGNTHSRVEAMRGGMLAIHHCVIGHTLKTGAKFNCVFAGYTVYVGHLSPASMPCIPVLISSAQPEIVIIVSTMTVQ